MKKYVLSALLVFSFSSLNATIINVPSQYPSISKALQASSGGDTILVAQGNYELPELLKIDKAVTVASNYIFSKDEKDINNTIIKPATAKMHEWFEVAANDTYIIGLKFIGNKRHTLNITAEYAYVTHCKFFGGNDQLSFSGGGGYVGYCYFENAGDDALDCDNSISWTIEHNTIVNAYQDGIEIRLHHKGLPLTTHNFRYNTVISAGQSGIQLIDYKGNSYREFYINNNIFQDCNGAGVSSMYKEKDNTNEVYRGSLMEETALVYNNTFVGCNYGLTISPGLLILNNIFANSKTTAIGRGIYVNDSNDKSITDYSIFYNNKSDFNGGVIVGENNLININPMLNDQFELNAGSPCIDKGILTYEWKGKKFNGTNEKYIGKSLDIGAVEFGLVTTDNKSICRVNIGNDIVIEYPKNKTILKGSVSGIEALDKLTYSWQKISGAGEVKFSNSDKLKTVATFSQEGIYEIMLTATSDQDKMSDVITIYFVDDFVDRTISVGVKEDALVEAENYRYLVASSKGVALPSGSVVITNEDKPLSYTQYQVSTTVAGTFYIWMRIKGSNNSVVSVSLNDLKEEKEIELSNKASNYIWKQVKFTKIPEGIYPLRIRRVNGSIILDKIFITHDSTKVPSK